MDRRISRVVSVRRDPDTDETSVQLQDERGRQITLRFPARQFKTLTKRVLSARTPRVAPDSHKGRDETRHVPPTLPRVQGTDPSRGDAMPALPDIGRHIEHVR